MSIHKKFFWFFAAVAVALFAAKYAFDVTAIGYWTFLPLVLLMFAGWFTDREKEQSDG